MAEMKRRNSKKQQNIILKQQKTMEKEANWHKTGNEETIQITEKDIMDMINKLEEQAFMDGYSYAIRLLKESIRKIK